MDLWPKVDVQTWKEYTRCFGCGQDNPVGLKLKFSWDGATARAEFTPDTNHQGWGGYVHGGITCCVLDEAMGWTALFNGYNNVTAKMQTRFRRMIPIGETCEVTCRIVRQTSRLIETEAKLVGKDGTIFADATSTQFIIGPRKEEPRKHEEK
jgi:acyl-coenzyme A thioesterase PaaI-like protein